MQIISMSVIMKAGNSLMERTFMRLLRLAGSAAAVIAVLSAGSASALDGPRLKPKPEYQVIGERFTLSLQSDAGSFLGGGKTFNYSDADSSQFFVNIRQTGTSTDILPKPDYLEIDFLVGKGAKANDSWFLTIGTDQLGKALATGTYNGATRAPFAVKNTPGLDFALNGSGCNTETGRFTVAALAFDCRSNGGILQSHLKQLVMNFEDHCEGATPAIRGQFSFLDLTGVSCDSTGTGGGSGGSGGGSGGGGTPPPSGPTVILPDNVLGTPLVMSNSSSATVPFSIFDSDNGTADVTLSASSDSPDLIASVNPSVIPAPGNGSSVLTLQTSSKATAGVHVVTITASDGTFLSSASVFVTILCDPPFILGLDQPKSSTVSIGRPALLSVKASGSGPFSYQWYTGASGLVNFPLPGGTTANFTTSALNDNAAYWVRVTNPCGSVDSQTANVSVTAGAKPASRPR